MYKESFKKQLVLETIKNFSKTSSFENALKNSLKKINVPSQDWKRIEKFHFPNGFQNLIEEFNKIINYKLNKKKLNLNKMGVSEKISFLVQSRITIKSEYKQSFKNIILNMIRPKNIYFSNKLLFKISDEIWFLSGDSSLDFNYYSKRLILMKIYFLTIVFWLKDKSSNNEKTFIFLQKQIKNVSKIGKYKFLIKSFINKFSK
ncbi:MAG: COQ9 family protein [Rickettsiales bacterium]|nr:COQ9 family protein [Rickettsiales bacterium]